MDDADLNFLSNGERAFLLALNDAGVRFMVVGMSAALLQGARGATEDIDLWFEDIADDRIGRAAKEVGGFFITRSHPPMFGGAIGDRIDIVFAMSGLPAFAPEYENAVEEFVSGVKLKILPLARILHSKTLAARTKDEPGIAQIKLVLAVMKTR
jgi:predicted nucleotidyltransferase